MFIYPNLATERIYWSGQNTLINDDILEKISAIVDKNGFWLGASFLNGEYKYICFAHDETTAQQKIVEKQEENKKFFERMNLRRQIDEAFTAKDWDKWRPLNEKYWETK
jgi:hypothetical protein